MTLFFFSVLLRKLARALLSIQRFYTNPALKKQVRLAKFVQLLKIFQTLVAYARYTSITVLHCYYATSEIHGFECGKRLLISKFPEDSQKKMTSLGKSVLDRLKSAVSNFLSYLYIPISLKRTSCSLFKFC